MKRKEEEILKFNNFMLKTIFNTLTMAQKIMVKVKNSTRVHVRGINALFFIHFSTCKDRRCYSFKKQFTNILFRHKHTNMLDDCKDKK